MQHKFPSIISFAEGLASACTIAGAFGLATGSISHYSGYVALLAGSLITLVRALQSHDRSLLARHGLLAGIHGWGIWAMGS